MVTEIIGKTVAVITLGLMGGGVWAGASWKGDREPRLLREVRPDYTAYAMEARMQGIVALAVEVLADGSMGDAHVTLSALAPTVRDAQKKFDDDAARGQLQQQAINAVRQWRFAPGTKDGMPVTKRIRVEMSFALR